MFSIDPIKYESFGVLGIISILLISGMVNPKLDIK
jgi:hypothetical protein